MTTVADPIVDFPALKEAREKLDAKRKALADIFAEAGPDYDMTRVKSLSGDSHAKVAEIGKLNKEIIECKGKVDDLQVVGRAAAMAAADAAEPETKHHSGVGESGSEAGTSGPSVKMGRSKAFGEQLMESPAIKSFVPGSGVGPMAHLDVELKTLFQTSAGWDPEDLRTGKVVPFATRPAPRVVDFVPQTTTSKSTVLYMEETTYTNAAAETAEGTAYPEAALALTEKSSEVRKIAVFLPVTDEQFEDEPRARAYVENRLPFMLRQRLDLQILTGSGVAPNLLGTENVAGIQVQALGADPIPDALYKVMRKIRDNGFAEPSVVFIQPSKWESVRLLRTADGVYIWGHPAIPGPTTIWGVPVVETTAHTSTKAIVGDYTNFSELAVRRGLDMQISNSHSTYFVEGKLALRVDLRAALLHYRPAAFGVVSGL